MPRFPTKEADIAALAEQIWQGLLANPAIYPHPPFLSPPLIVRKIIYRQKHDAALATRSAAESATTAKDEAMDDLVAAMKSDLRYAETAVDFDDDKLKLLGWSVKATKTPLVAPGQTRLLEAVKQGPGWVMLDWKAPADGGKPKAYKVQRRSDGAEPVSDRWEDVATAIQTDTTLVDQPRGAELEYRVIAVNKAGEGLPSNTVEVVL